ncbi:hypothetical protein AVEN_245957-1 [Araneus ventricosus]|uniref:Uncharacterized protein n=1 Tax=Araneus ventricosus TaxID=182803 RepID=A0A4Y2UE19_ARAVE|nr:hypothetical protein AVEN_245957-1 [Araneus ventricosus]
MPNDSGDISVIENSLMISITWINEEPFVNLQRFFEKKDFSRQFFPSVCLLSEAQWMHLNQIRKDLTSAAIRLLFSKIFLNLLRKEVSGQTPKALSSEECGDIEMVLTTSLLELLRDYLGENIVTNMESRFPAMRVLWLGREFYKVKHGVTSATVMAP